MKNSVIVLIFLGLALLTMGFQCDKDVPAYRFAEKLSLSPYRKSYAVGDTIWVQFQTANKTLFDKLSGSRIATDSTFILLNFKLNRYYPIGSAAELFGDIKVDNGLDVSFTSLSTYVNILSFKTDCSNSAYFFRVGFVPKMKGVYAVEPNGDVVPCQTSKRFPYSIFQFAFDLADCNKDVWLSLPPESRGGDLNVKIDKKEIFMFKVE